GSATLSSGAASITVANLQPGSHPITAIYGGTANFASSSSRLVTETVKRVTTWVEVTGPSAPLGPGQGATFTANVLAAGSDAGPLEGVVLFYDNIATTGVYGSISTEKVYLGQAAVFGGSASISTSSLGVGTHSVSAEYGRLPQVDLLRADRSI